MWINRFPPRSNFLRFHGGKSVSVQKRFQRKYTFFLMGALLFALTVSILPIYFFFTQNYAIFFELAYQHSPELLDHLEREKAWLQLFLVVISIFTMVGCWFFGMSSTAKIINPVLVLQNHIKALTRGNWAIGELKVRDGDEFRDLVSSYNYLYQCLHQVTQEDIKKLEGLVIDRSHPGAQRIWRELLDEKSEQLGVKINAPVEDFETFRDSRHAS